MEKWSTWGLRTTWNKPDTVMMYLLRSVFVLSESGSPVSFPQLQQLAVCHIGLQEEYCSCSTRDDNVIQAVRILCIYSHKPNLFKQIGVV